MSARRGLYFQMCRWDQSKRGKAAADACLVRACGASDDPRLVRLMQDRDLLAARETLLADCQIPYNRLPDLDGDRARD